MYGSTIGIAYVGAICYAPQYAFGVTQSFGILTSNVFAHELGHNLGAPHDTSTPGSLMYPSISFGTSYFSAKSLSDINGFLAYFGSCLENEDLPPSVNGATLKIKRNRNRITGSLVSKKGTPIDSKVVVITFGKIARTKTTNIQGKFVVNIPRTKSKRVRVTASLVENPSIKTSIVIKL
jgi:hypothetical protein